MFTPKASPAEGPSQPSSRSAATKPHRSLACELCQKRKIKCDRSVPCGSCVQAGVECVPTTQPRVRRRRFPERELLERLRYYESLLSKNGIKFDPMHGAASQKAPLRSDDAMRLSHEPDQARMSVEEPDSSSRKTSESRGPYEAKSIWHAINQRATPEDDEDEDSDERVEVRASVIKKAWDQSDSHDHLLFGSHTRMDLSTMHPDQIQIFRLWQIYLENVDPMFKVTHTPTLQPRLIDAARDVTNIRSSLEALMFGIYCVAIVSLNEDQCLSLFGMAKKELLSRYRSGCQQALHDSNVLRTDERDCLTALFLYLVSVRLDTDPRSLSATLGMAVRIAQRMGIHQESANAKCTVFEAEMRRRLWWGLMLFDSRISEMDGGAGSILTPLWDCQLPSNLNDSDLQPAMAAHPTVHNYPTEAIFVVMRSKIAQFTRNSGFHLDFNNPILKTVATYPGTIDELERTIENDYLRLCNPEHPLHYMTIWMSRDFVAKSRMMELYNTAASPPTEEQRLAFNRVARDLLNYDGQLLKSPMTQKFRWLVLYHFPFPAYMLLALDLRKHPLGEEADKSWRVMSDNYIVRFSDAGIDNPFFRIFTRIILQSWAPREAQNPEWIPEMVADVKRHVAFNDPPSNDLAGTDFSMPMLIDFDDYSLLFGNKDERPVRQEALHPVSNFGW